MGGAVFYSCANEIITKTTHCVVNIKEYNVFEKNFAEHDGGAIIFIQDRYNDDNTNIFKNNRGMYGGISASYPQELKFEFLNMTFNSNLTSNSSIRLLNKERYL
jgi:hypothetical protein